MTSGEFHPHIVKITEICKFPNPEAEERAIRCDGLKFVHTAHSYTL